MKKLITTGLLIGLVTSALAQGQVTLRNIFNSDPSPTATSNGLFWYASAFTPLSLITSDFSVVFYGGVNASSLNLLGSFTGASTIGDNAAGPGTFFSNTIATIPGVPF